MKVYKYEEFKYLLEGIDIKNKTISYNSNHNNGVDFRSIVNPSYIKLDIDGFGKVDVISIFKRNNKSEHSDGNPLVYALKGIFDWKFENFKRDYKKVFKEFVDIINKINYKYDYAILVPSSSRVNTEFYKKVSIILNNKSEVVNGFNKLSVSDIYKNIDFQGIDKNFHGDYKDDLINQLEEDFEKMLDDDKFDMKKIDNSIRKYVKRLFAYFGDEKILYNKINNKKVLIIDDVVSYGTSLKLFSEYLVNNFNVSDIKIITLFSPL